MRDCLIFPPKGIPFRADFSEIEQTRGEFGAFEHTLRLDWNGHPAGDTILVETEGQAREIWQLEGRE